MFCFKRGVTLVLSPSTTHILLQQRCDNSIATLNNLSVFLIIFTDNVLYFIYRTVSKSPKQLLNVLKGTKSSLVQFDFRGVLFHVSAVLQIQKVEIIQLLFSYEVTIQSDQVIFFIIELTG